VCIPYEKRGLPNRNRISLFARHLGVNHLKNPVPFLQPTFEEYVWARDIIVSNRSTSNSAIISLAPGSNEDKRSWRPERVKEFVRIANKKYPSVLILSFDMHDALGETKHLQNVLDMSSTTVRQMAALIQQSHVFVGPDSGPMHIAGALKKESIALFGSIPPEARTNFYKRHESVVAKNVSCLGCWYDHCPYNIKCMDQIAGSSVLYKAMDKIYPENKVCLVFNEKAIDAETMLFQDLSLSLDQIELKHSVFNQERSVKAFNVSPEGYYNRNPKEGKSEKLLTCFSPGKENKKHPEFYDARQRYLYFAWESTRPPEEWAKPINTYDKLIVNSIHTIEGLRETGVTIPISCVPSGIDTKFWSFQERKEIDKVRFLVCSPSTWKNGRSNLEKAYEAFISAFENREDVELVIKVCSGKIPDRVLSHKNIIGISEEYSNERMRELFASVDCIIYPGKASRHGLTVKKAMSTGLPAVGCIFGNLNEVFSLDCNFSVGFHLCKADLSHKQLAGVDLDQDFGLYASFSTDALSSVLEEVVSKKDELRERGRMASDFISEKHSIDIFRGRIIQAMASK